MLIRPVMPPKDSPTSGLMAEDPATLDLVDLTRRFAETASCGDLDELVGFFARDGVWDMSPAGMGTFEGRGAIRGLLEDWFAGYAKYEIKVHEIVNLGNGVVFAITRQNGLLADSTSGGVLREVWAYPFLWIDGMLARLTTYADVDEGRAVAERLAEERG